jgi:hypothetical protein
VLVSALVNLLHLLLLPHLRLLPALKLSLLKAQHLLLARKKVKSPLTQ